MIKKEHALLSGYTTFQLGGPCRFLIECRTPEELIETLAILNTDKTPFILIGGGSNVVISDQGIDTAVIRYLSPAPIIKRTGNTLWVSANTILDDLALYCVDEGFEGLNFATGIPGTVGGAAVGNAGAWGKQIGDVLVSADIITIDGKTKHVTRDYFAFSYRHSALKENNDIILGVNFNLTPKSPLSLAQERAEILKSRADKHPNLSTHPCAGSFFRNIEPTSKAERRQASGAFLEDAGAKNMRVGGAYVFEKHANIIVKGPSAKAQDVHDLHVQMMTAVKEKFGLQLIREVRFAGKFSNAASANETGFW